MRKVWKVLLSLAVVLPLGAFVVGSLVTSAAEAPAPRHTIVIEDSSTPSPDSPTTPSQTADPSHPAESAGSPGGTRTGHGDDPVGTIDPTPDRVYDDHGGERSGRGGDDSGHGGEGHG